MTEHEAPQQQARQHGEQSAASAAGEAVAAPALVVDAELAPRRTAGNRVGQRRVLPEAVLRRLILGQERTLGNRAVQRLLRTREERREPAAAGGRPLLQRFEARMHQAAERVGLTTDARGGATGSVLSNEEASAVYFGNWMRDINQVFVPIVSSLLPNDVVFGMVSYLAARKFGREMSAEQFGFYIPAEHIDSPAGLVAQDDLLPGQPEVSSSPPAQRRPPEFATPQEERDVDPRTARVLGANLFAVDQTGVAAWIRRTNLHVERRLELAAQRDRSPEGMMHFGAALHAIEDLFAHSNWIEIAVNRVLELDRTLLPDLRDEERFAFTYAPDVEVGRDREGQPVNRPVLMTGSFTGTDTQISITSELITFMSEPLPPPQGNAEAQAEERFVAAFLRMAEATLRNNPQFRRALRDAISGALPDIPGRGAAVDLMLRLPLEDLYNLTRVPIDIPDSWKEATVRPIQRLIREQLSERVLQPAAHRLQAEALGARVQDTSLIQFLRDNQRRAQGQFNPAERRLQEETARLGGGSVRQQQREGRASAGRHVEALQATPEAVVAGPSHSQINKDHPDSPFFGLAFRLATIAVRTMRERMVAAWDERRGSPTRRFNFDNWPPASEAEARNLYQEPQNQQRREEREQESLAMGTRILQQGNLEAAPWDLAAMRRDSAAQVRAAAGALRAIARGPGESASQLQRLNALLGQIDQERMASIRAQLQEAARTARGGGQRLDSAAALNATANDLDQVANAVEQARAHRQREETNANLVNQRDAALRALAITPALNTGLAASILLVLDQQIARTAVAYTTEQRRVVEGQTHIRGHTGPETLSVQNITLPDLRRNERREARSPALIALLQASRDFLAHPYDGTWWEATVVDHIRTHERQIRADIEARNAGVPGFFRPGAPGGGHQH